MRISTPELILIFGIVILLFGVGRISKIAGEVGKGIRAFRRGIKEVTQEEEAAKPKDLE